MKTYALCAKMSTFGLKTLARTLPKKFRPHSVLNVPIAHGEGRFTIDSADYQTLLENNQIAFRYVDAENQTTAEANPNGSFDNIAGIINKSGNILGMMPHPERAVESLLGSIDGQSIFNALKN